MIVGRKSAAAGHRSRSNARRPNIAQYQISRIAWLASRPLHATAIAPGAAKSGRERGRAL